MHECRSEVGDVHPSHEWWSCSSSGYHSGVGTSEVSVKERAALNASLTTDYASDDDSDWGEDEWPVERPLPLPEWGCGRPEVNFSTLHHYQRFLARLTHHLHHALADLPYDTLSNFITFSKEFVESRDEYPELLEFYRDYDPPLLPGRYTCVGLAADLATRLSVLETNYPGLKDATYQVSCEEEVKALDWYCSLKEPPVASCIKEHVLLCIRIRVAGRAGVLLFDPGYHVGEPITVMEDGLAPQSGIIKASTTRSEVHRTFQYHFCADNPAFVAWEVVEERDGKPKKKFTSLIHVSRPFLSGVDIAERRNLVETFKTLLGRDDEGHLTCGLYFPIRNCYNTNISFFHQVEGIMKHLRQPLSSFLDDALLEEVEEAVAAVAAGIGRTKNDLQSSLVTLAHLLLDEDLVKQVMELNSAIIKINSSLVT
ncbi:hypothetical protein Hamer_G012343 [Homarus americanus]|uniref:Uncharacterized protein n=1 Tax=Homarus americanus TaxID=6706 RepID=A0A8J5MZV1_HOMAM|nr:hypothetical protein Hamer_G012343 [Homarus americanus]